MAELQYGLSYAYISHDRRSEPYWIAGFFPQNINRSALPDQPHCQIYGPLKIEKISLFINDEE